jgi:agmatine deiminase
MSAAIKPAGRGGLDRKRRRLLAVAGVGVGVGVIAACAPAGFLRRPRSATGEPPGGDADQTGGAGPRATAPPPDEWGGPAPLEDQAWPGWRLSADFEPLARLWLAFDAGHTALTRGLVAALHPQVRLGFVVPDADAQVALSRWLAAEGLAVADIRFVVEPAATFFLRDMAVFAAGPQGQLGIVDFHWTEYGMASWCAKRYAGATPAARACEDQTDLRREWADRRLAKHWGANLLRSSLAAEGGGVEVNGRGLLIANEALWSSRNPNLGRSEMERRLLRLPSVSRVIWLPEGLAEDPLLRARVLGPYVAWGTGGHTDEFVRFADERTVLLAWPEAADANAHPVVRLSRERMQRAHEILVRASTVSGQPLRVLRVPMPSPIQRRVWVLPQAQHENSVEWREDYFAPGQAPRVGQPVWQLATASYLNFVVANGALVLPDYTGHGTSAARQERVRRVFEQAFPGRAIHFVDAISANWVGGGLHCATLSEPQPA